MTRDQIALEIKNTLTQPTNMEKLDALYRKVQAAGLDMDEFEAMVQAIAGIKNFNAEYLGMKEHYEKWKKKSSASLSDIEPHTASEKEILEDIKNDPDPPVYNLSSREGMLNALENALAKAKAYPNMGLLDITMGSLGNIFTLLAIFCYIIGFRSGSNTAYIFGGLLTFAAFLMLNNKNNRAKGEVAGTPTYRRLKADFERLSREAYMHFRDEAVFRSILQDMDRELKRNSIRRKLWFAINTTIVTMVAGAICFAIYLAPELRAMKYDEVQIEKGLTETAITKAEFYFAIDSLIAKGELPAASKKLGVIENRDLDNERNIYYASKLQWAKKEKELAEVRELVLAKKFEVAQQRLSTISWQGVEEGSEANENESIFNDRFTAAYQALEAVLNSQSKQPSKK